MCLLKKALGTIGRRNRKAGVDRGLKHSMVISIKNGEDEYSECMINRQELFMKRESLRQRTRLLMSQIARKRNNWEKKHLDVIRELETHAERAETRSMRIQQY